MRSSGPPRRPASTAMRTDSFYASGRLAPSSGYGAALLGAAASAFPPLSGSAKAVPPSIRLNLNGMVRTESVVLSRVDGSRSRSQPARNLVCKRSHRATTVATTPPDPPSIADSSRRPR